jgi:hypothetical protein
MKGILLAALLAASRAESADRALIRQEKTVRVSGQDEQWRLVWATLPKPSCVPQDDMWYTCPCSGFAFGERGHLRLERAHDGTVVETLDLDQFFAGFSRNGRVFQKRESILRRWDVLRGDDELMDDAPHLQSQLDTRPSADVMELVDFDHDGQASEFFLQVGVLPCAKSMGVVVGVSKSHPRLHVFATAEHPARPLVLQDRIWTGVAQQTKGHAITWQCGDHAADYQSEITWRVDRTGIHAHVTTVTCGDGSPGKQIERTDL